MLRGDLRRARAKFDVALRLDPNNATAINNLALLNQSTRFVERRQRGTLWKRGLRTVNLP